MIKEMQLKKPIRHESIVTRNLYEVVEVLNEFVENSDVREVEETMKEVHFVGEGSEIVQSLIGDFIRNSNVLSDGLREIVSLLELIISVSEQQDKGRTIIFNYE